MSHLNNKEEHHMVFENIKPLPTEAPIPRPLSNKKLAKVMEPKLEALASTFGPKYAPKTAKPTTTVDNNGWGKTFDLTNVTIHEAGHADFISTAAKKSKAEKSKGNGKKARK